MQYLTIIERILRDRTTFFGEVRNQQDLRNKIVSMMISSFVFLAMYGLIMGARHSLLQGISSAIKLPILFLVTLIICTPSLYFFNLLFGSQQTIGQFLSLILTGITTNAVLLLSLAPVTFFFLLTTSVYPFYKLLNVVFFAIAGILGVAFLWQGYRSSIDEEQSTGRASRRLIFLLWVVLYAFVGSQMAWTLSPFMGNPELEFMLVAQRGGNFYADVIASLRALLAP